jgi:hypothetical protein
VVRRGHPRGQVRTTASINDSGRKPWFSVLVSNVEQHDVRMGARVLSANVDFNSSLPNCP